MSAIKIDKKVPFPEVSELPSKLPLKDMVVGDSFLLKVNPDSSRSALRQRLSRYQNSNPPSKFIIRVEKDGKGRDVGLRVFRFKDEVG